MLAFQERRFANFRELCFANWVWKREQSVCRLGLSHVITLTDSAECLAV